MTDEKTITINKSTYTKLLTVVVIALMAASFATGFIAGNSGKTGQVVAPIQEEQPAQPEAPTQPQQPEQPKQPSKVQVSADNDAVKGDENAPITIVEFSDFQCPYCGRFFAQTLPQLEKDYIETGKAKLVYRDFPLSFHENAQKAAEAAECAKEQGKFWEYHDIVFGNQNSLDVASLKQYASDIGLNTDQFDSCLDSGKYKSEVQQDFQAGSRTGVSGTPTFFIGNDKDGYEKLVGAQPYSAFKQVLDRLLE